ncbi:MAG: DUF2249 domain-containing protein [Gallionellaceae bacterium]|nr:DUF2249 domain-containing protein [Gallionellaceae bacterium]
MTADPAVGVRELDVRDLEPPEPLQQALAALAALKPGEQLRMLHHREPFPLYAILRERGFTYRTTQLADDNYEVLIWP